MFDQNELDIITTTLGHRSNWLQKQLQDPQLVAAKKEEYQNIVSIINSIQVKLERLAVQSTKTQAPSPKKRLKPSVDPADAYILIAEDNADSAELLHGILEEMGFETEHITHVSDGRAALFALQNCSPPYDIVLCDWDMPEMTGLEVRKAVKNLAKLQDTHFMMVTAMTEAAQIKEAINEGIGDYIVKPIDIDTLEKKLRLALAGEAAAEPNKQA